MTFDPILVLLAVVEVLDELGLDYAVGGSVASSVFGEPRASADADLIVRLPSSRVSALVGKLAGDFYVSEKATREAVHRGASFNVIHLASAYKVDLFVAGSGTLDREQMTRRQEIVLVRDPERRVYITAAENVILRKLDWYRRGGGTSDQQWRDVIGVLKVQGARLDYDYLEHVAEQVGLATLLAQAREHAGGAR